jgi:hypothetical protein
MSCSKIFSGDLPEITYNIINFFKNDFSTLHSCILVNRLWCRLAISLLWENPFSIPTGSYNFIEIYLNNLNNDLKSKLNEYEINDNLLPSLNTTFNYPSFIKYLNTSSITFSIERWFEDTRNRYILRHTDKTNFSKLICMSLFKLFIENEVNLHIFEIEINNYPNLNSHLDDILELMLKNPNFIHNIKNLKLHLIISNVSFNDNTEKLVRNRITQIVNSNYILKKVVLGYKGFPLYQSLLLSNNCSVTLNTITFFCINFKGITNLDKMFEQLNVLESVHIIYCSSLNIDFAKQIINLNKPFKLKSLFITELISHIEALQLLLQKSGDYLENFGYGIVNGFDSPFKQQIFESLIKYCKNIKFLELYQYSENQIYLVLNLIENIKQNLNFLSIDVCQVPFSIDAVELSSIILRNLGQLLPSKLEYLSLTLSVNINDFNIFLKNSENTFFRKLLINNKGGDDILSCIKENIMKKKRVKYLSIHNTLFDEYNVDISKENDLFSLKDEVKEFDSYDIKIKEYNDLLIYILIDFAKELD